MSAFYPYDASGGDDGPDGKNASARESALERELQALRLENRHLRRRYARLIQGSEPESSGDASLPLSLNSELIGTSPAEQETLLHALSGVFPMGIFRIDSAGVLTHVDDALKRIFDLEAQDFPHFGWLRRIHPDDLERVTALWHACVSQPQSLSVEFRLLRADGSVAHLLIRNVLLKEHNGTLSGQTGFVQDITSLRKLQADVQTKDDLNQQILANSPDCTKVLDLQGHVLQMTAQGCRLLEVDNFEEVRAQRWVSWWPDDNAEMADAAVDSARQGRTARFIGRANTLKGNPKWWDNTLSPILDIDGNASMLLVVSRDITDQYQQQNEIQQLNAELENRVHQRTEELAQAKQRVQETLREAQALYDQAPCGYHSVDADGMYVAINQTELDWLGATRDAVIGKKSFHDFIDPVSRDEMDLRFEHLKQGAPLDPVEVHMRRADGSSFVALISSTTVRDEANRFVHSNSTLVDITERKAAQVALEAQRAFLQTITNSVPVQLAFYDQNLVCRFANASYARWLNGVPEDLIGLHLNQIAAPDDYNNAQAALASALAGTPQRFEGERVFPDGQRFYGCIEYAPYWHQGHVMGLFIQMLDISERKASEDRIKHANGRLRRALEQSQALYNQAPCGYHSLDVNGRYVAINDTELEWLGYTREEVVGHKHFSDFVLPGGVPLLENRLETLIRDGALSSAEYELRRRDGSTFFALLSTSSVVDEQGKFLRSNTTVVDISQRKAAELALSENQRFLQTITDHVPGQIAYLDSQLRFQFANIKHLTVYGMNPAIMQGSHIAECVKPDVWREIEPYIKGALRGEVQHFESWRQTVNGAPIYASATYLPDVRQGKVHGIFVQIIDITDRKRVEERVNQLNDELEQRIRERSAELLESEQRFRLMVDNLREYSIYFMDADGRISDWTDSAQRMKGYSPTEMLGKHYATLFDLRTAEECMEAANQAFRLAASRGQHVLHTWLTRKDGSKFWAHSLLIALRDGDGELRGFAKINRDMSDAKRLEDLMRNINDELENRVTERTEQLLVANKDLEAFSYSVSHDLRSPLRHISSFVSLLEEQLKDQPDALASRYLNTIGSSARHMSQLIDGLLAFSRLGRSAVNLAPVDFSLLVEAVVNQMSHDTEGRVVEWVIAPDLPVAQGDALLLREVWANLLGNAFKYSRPREHTRIEIGWSVDPAVGYTFFVRDNGVGFDTKYAQKLFGVFQRLHRASEFEGTGIGLALTRRILERHGGNIWADSELGKGSVFYFSLPFEGVNHPDTQSDSFFATLEP